MTRSHLKTAICTFLGFLSTSLFHLSLVLSLRHTHTHTHTHTHLLILSVSGKSISISPFPGKEVIGREKVRERERERDRERERERESKSVKEIKKALTCFHGRRSERVVLLEPGRGAVAERPAAGWRGWAGGPACQPGGLPEPPGSGDCSVGSWGSASPSWPPTEGCLTLRHTGAQTPNQHGGGERDSVLVAWQNYTNPS